MKKIRMIEPHDKDRDGSGGAAGFTLVEILIVVVIIGVLATVTVFAVRGIANRASTNACANEQKTMLTAYDAYLTQEETNVIAPTGVGADRYELTMVSVGTLRSVSSNWELAADGTITAQAGGQCT